MATSLEFLKRPQRRPKPRQCGLTLVRDPGLSVRELENALRTFGNFKVAETLAKLVDIGQLRRAGANRVMAGAQ